jgi:hypothetical protein
LRLVRLVLFLDYQPNRLSAHWLTYNELWLALEVAI